MDIEKICINNLGKEVNYDSFNRSYALVYPKNYEEQLIL